MSEDRTEPTAIAEADEHKEPVRVSAAAADKESQGDPSVIDSEPVQLQPANETMPAAESKSRRPRVIFTLLFVMLVGIALYLGRHQIMTYVTPEHKNGAAQESAANDEKKILYWVDPMHPAYKSDKPGSAPDCGMDLVPVYAEEETTAKNQMPKNAIQISPYKQQLIGVQFGTVTYQSIGKTIRANGKVTYDETKITRVHTKVEGWIENVYVDFTGKQVKNGDPLLSIYSPDLLQTQQEFLLSVKMRNELGNSQYKEAAEGSHSLYQSARRRLELWDISVEQIDEIEKRGVPVKNLTLYAPADGFVLTRNSYPKQKVMPDTELYALADLSTVWVVADIYEYEAAEIRVGMRANITLSYQPGRVYRGKVSYIYPQLDNTTRTLKVRIEIPNPDYQLKPDMYANVELRIDYGQRLTLPQEAIMDSGTEQMVFIALGDGYFVPRRVKLGDQVGDRVIVLDGVAVGEAVVTSANFLIDSESKLKAAAGAIGAHGHGSEQPKTQTTVQPEANKDNEDHSQHGQSPQQR